MARRIGASPHQKSLAEELSEVEAEEKVTGALQAVDPHSMKHKHGPKGQEPQEPKYEGVPNTPSSKPKRGNTPSPVKIDKDGDAWELEDHEDQEGEETPGGERTQSDTDRRACAGSVVTEGLGG